VNLLFKLFLVFIFIVAVCAAVAAIIGAMRREMKPKAYVEPPDLENFAYKIAVAPNASRVFAWSKFQECERRLEYVKWAESLNDPRLAERRVFLFDSVSAFLLTFEATIQILKSQWKKSVKVDFDVWLKSLSEYDLHMRGLRTLRHFEAHVESRPVTSLVKLHIKSGFGIRKPPPDVSRAWMLKPLQKSDLDRLDRSPLPEAELSDWNAVVSRLDVQGVFVYGLGQLKKILETAETRV
jgi:hypothetical protein